jgi:AcrR family transcriptional regulator
MSKPVKSDAAPARARGRPRSHRARAAILRAARELLEENGLAALTIEGIAARAAVGKPTIYRWWPDRHAVAMAALMESPRPAESEGRGGGHRQPALASLQQQLGRVADVFAQPVGRAAARIIAAADNDSELARAFRNHFILARREEGRTLLQQSMDQGEIRRDLDLEVAVDMIYGALFFRLLMGHAPLDERLAGQILAQALLGLRA